MDLNKAMVALNDGAAKLKEEIANNPIENNALCNLITDLIYNACRGSYKKKNDKDDKNDEACLANLKNCNSSNFKAIAHANRITFDRLKEEGIDDERSIVYLVNWIKFNNMALKAESNEINTKINKSWKNGWKNPKKLWEMVDWKGKSRTEDGKNFDNEGTYEYFKNIFKSEKTQNHPVISDDLLEDINLYDVCIPITDCTPTKVETELAIKKFGNGVGNDGIPADIITSLPQSLKELILELITNVFHYDYPYEWSKQILHSIQKKGHTRNDPKSRGIAVATSLCRIYDVILDERFLAWYTPNKEQGGFRAGQGCLNQIFILVLLIDYANEQNRSFFTCFMDYEEAFDFANRHEITTHLMKKGCGKMLTKAISKSLKKSIYMPKLFKSIVIRHSAR